jgi:hypothetical protein
MRAALVVASVRALLTFDWSESWPVTRYSDPDRLAPRFAIAIRFNEAVQPGPKGNFTLVSGNQRLATSVENIAFGMDATDTTKGIIVVPPYGNAIKNLRLYSVGIDLDVVLDPDARTLPAVDPNDPQGQVYQGDTAISKTVPFVLTTIPTEKTMVNEGCAIGEMCFAKIFYSEIVMAGPFTDGSSGIVSLYTPAGVAVTGVKVVFGSSGELDAEGKKIPSNALHVGVPAAYLLRLAGEHVKLSIYPGAVVNSLGSACAKFTAKFYVGVQTISYTPRTVEATVSETVTVQFSAQVNIWNPDGPSVLLRSQDIAGGPDILVPRSQLRLDRTNYERTGTSLAILTDQVFTAGEEYIIYIDNALKGVLPQAYTFRVKGASAQDYASPSLLTLHPANKTDDERPCTKEMFNCAFFALFSECVNVSGVFLTPSHAQLDLIFGTSEPMVLGRDFVAFPHLPCTDPTAGPYYSAYWRFEPAPGKRFLSGRRYKIQAMNYTDIAGNAGDEASLAMVESVIPPMIVRYFPNETDYAHARTTLFIEYLDEVITEDIRLSPNAFLIVACNDLSGKFELQRNYHSASVTVKSVTNFLVVGDEWVAKPGGSKELTCNVNVNPGFASYDLQPTWSWTFITKVADFNVPEWLFTTRNTTTAPAAIGEAHDLNVPVFADLIIAWNEEITPYNGTSLTSNRAPGSLRVYIEMLEVDERRTRKLAAAAPAPAAATAAAELPEEDTDVEVGLFTWEMRENLLIIKPPPEHWPAGRNVIVVLEDRFLIDHAGVTNTAVFFSFSTVSDGVYPTLMAVFPSCTGTRNTS